MLNQVQHDNYWNPFIKNIGNVDNRGRISGELALIPESFFYSGYNSPKLKDVFYLLVMNLPMQRICVFSNSRNKRCLLPFVRICFKKLKQLFRVEDKTFSTPTLG
jgi:hypothetical protein